MPLSPPWADRFNDQSGTAHDPHWPAKRPALTIATKAIVPNPGHNSSRFDSATKSRNDGLHITVAEAATLQTYPAHIMKGSPMGIVALDLFAGHGWGVACQWLGIEEHGVELMDGAVATREANGMSTIYRDVWEGLERPNLLTAEATVEVRAAIARVFDPDTATSLYDLLIASPPCQTFSMAGGGSGRKALDEVVGLIDARAYMDVAKLREFGERHDPRTALVLTPLAHVYRDLPRYVVLEQVPPVLPVWERMAEELQKWGYSTWTGVLNAEQYGVPQTRRRAILIAKRDPEIDGPAAPPEVTHSRYYSRDPEKLDEGVLPWVSMADALGWGRDDELVSNYGTGGDPAARGKRRGETPAPTMTSKADRNVVVRTSMGAPKVDGRNGSHELDPYRRPMHTVTSKSDSVVFISNDKQANSAKRSIADPAPTITAGHDSGNRVWVNGTGEHAAKREENAPAPTVHFGQRVTGVSVETETTKRNVVLEEVATLQTYPQAFVWPGNKTTSFLQIGNAVPPVLAWAVLKAVLGER